jgi:hypothetical protein
MLTPTPGVTQTCHPSTKNKYSKVQRDFSSCDLAKGERGHRIKKYMLKKHRKQYAPIKEYRKKRREKENMTPSKNKSKECLEKHKNIPHTCKSRSSCMTSFFLDPVFGSTISCGTSEPHTYPTQSSTYNP